MIFKTCAIFLYEINTNEIEKKEESHTPKQYQ
jgi:hypothetical protein